MIDHQNRSVDVAGSPLALSHPGITFCATLEKPLKF